MKKGCITFFIFFTCSFLQAQNVKQLWASCFHENSGGIYPSDMATDKSGNSYITGYIQDPEYYLLKHYFLLKNNSDGVFQWIRYYPFPDSFSVGNAVAADDYGNVYVAGQRYDTACNICTIQIPYSYLFTIKYDATGSIVWHNVYDGPKGTNQEAAELVVTKQGRVYVVANEKKYIPEIGNYEIKMVTQKIHKSGITGWVKKKPNAIGNGIALDKDENVLVAASSSDQNIYQLNKFLTVKYTSTGNLVFEKTFSEYNKNGNAYSIAADTAGNIYVNGQSDTIAFYNNPQILTLKYSSAGDFIWWKKEADHSYTLPHYYGSYAIDAKGNSYITGYLKITDVNRDWTVVKRNPNGKILWQVQYDGDGHAEDVPCNVKVDASGNVFVTGYSYRNKSYAGATIQYDKAGIQQWIKFYKTAPRTNYFPVGLGLDDDGNAYVAGGGNDSLCTIKYGKKINVPAIDENISQPRRTFGLYPNPSSGTLILNVAGLTPGKYTCNIYSNTGQLMMSTRVDVYDNKDMHTLQLENLRAGMYMLQLTDGKNMLSQKFLKE